MIRLERIACPDCLTDAPSTGDSYKKKEVVEFLWKMQHGKCCYSEMPLPKEGHGKAVEHFRPKSLFRFLRNEWNNLLLVCPQCNGKKRDKFPVILTDNEDETDVIYLQTPSNAKPAIIDPCDLSVDPENHLTYALDDTDDELFGQIVPRAESALGRETIEVTGIYEEFFVRERRHRVLEVLEGTYKNVLLAKSRANEDALQVALRTFAQHMDDTAPFAGLARQYARHKNLGERFGLEIPGPAVS